MNKNRFPKKTAQEIQDEIFRRMPVGRKLEIASLLWKLGKDLASDKINYAKHKSDRSFGKYR